MSGFRWYCMECHRDLGPMVGKHESKCPDCGCKSAYCTKGGPDVKPMRMRLEVDDGRP